MHGQTETGKGEGEAGGREGMRYSDDLQVLAVYELKHTQAWESRAPCTTVHNCALVHVGHVLIAWCIHSMQLAHAF